MQLQPSEISDLIKSKIQNLDTHAEVRTQGTVVSVTDGICRVHGLSDAMAGEMLEFPGNTFGLALNLERDSVGAVILGQYEHITEGDTVKCTGKILSVPVGPELIGRVVDTMIGVVSKAKLSPFATWSDMASSINRPALSATRSGAKDDSPAAIRSASTKIGQPASLGRNSRAKVVLPAP